MIAFEQKEIDWRTVGDLELPVPTDMLNRDPSDLRIREHAFLQPKHQAKTICDHSQQHSLSEDLNSNQNTSMLSFGPGVFVTLREPWHRTTAPCSSSWFFVRSFHAVSDQCTIKSCCHLPQNR